MQRVLLSPAYFWPIWNASHKASASRALLEFRYVRFGRRERSCHREGGANGSNRSLCAAAHGMRCACIAAWRADAHIKLRFSSYYTQFVATLIRSLSKLLSLQTLVVHKQRTNCARTHTQTSIHVHADERSTPRRTRSLDACSVLSYKTYAMPIIDMCPHTDAYTHGRACMAWHSNRERTKSLLLHNCC